MTEGYPAVFHTHLCRPHRAQIDRREPWKSSARTRHTLVIQELMFDKQPVAVFFSRQRLVVIPAARISNIRLCSNFSVKCLSRSRVDPLCAKCTSLAFRKTESESHHYSAVSKLVFTTKRLSSLLIQLSICLRRNPAEAMPSLELGAFSGKPMLAGLSCQKEAAEKSDSIRLPDARIYWLSTTSTPHIHDCLATLSYNVLYESFYVRYGAANGYRA